MCIRDRSLNARSVDEPAGEGNLRGSREGFADLLRVNTSLLRRCFRNDALVIEIGQADCEMKTEYALCYCRDTADPKAVQKVRQTLQRARPQLLLDSSYFVPWLFPCKDVYKRQGPGQTSPAPAPLSTRSPPVEWFLKLFRHSKADTRTAGSLSLIHI